MISARLALPLLLLSLLACDEGVDDEQLARTHATRDALQPDALTHLDSGNTAFSRGDYASAREHYRAATEVQETHAAPWFGLYMAERALGDSAAAEAALRRSRDLSPAAGATSHPAAGTLPPDHPDVDGALPPAHPPMPVPEDHPPVGDGAAPAQPTVEAAPD